MKPQTTRHCARWLSLIAIAAAVTACGGNQRELQAYIDDIKARPGGAIEPLPEIRPAPSYVYEPGDRRSPFVPDAPQRAIGRGPGSVDAPDPDRPRENLERYPLDSLTMVGTLSDERGDFGLIQDAEGLVHTITVGNYMGQNNGRITSITDSRIGLTEIVPDGLGGHIERPATIALNNTQ
jgi:type IV pilus assembly protein PilP